MSIWATLDKAGGVTCTSMMENTFQMKNVTLTQNSIKKKLWRASFIELAQVYMTHQNKIATTLIQTSQNNSPYNAKYIKVTSDEVACPNKQK